jgi:sulfatase maturation enzyme AslB (radical SAM superfamily)
VRPDHLAVYLSNRCNLQCRYCYVAVNQGPASWLEFEAIRRSVDRFLSERRGETPKFTFLGGEPLLNFGLLQRVVEYVRTEAGPDAVLQTFTNGVLLTAEKLEWLERRGVFVTLSLDGDKATNDAKRVFAGGSDRSVHDEVTAALKDVPKRNLGVSLVFDSSSVGRLLRNVERFRQEGYSRITFNPDLYERWPDEKIRELEAVMSGLLRYYKAVLDGGRPFTIPILFSILENERRGPAWWHECHNEVLGPDGGVYACDKALSFPLELASSAKTGDAASGPDWDRRAVQLADARAEVESAVGAGKQHSFCPMGVVFYGRIAGSPVRPLLDNFVKVSDAFGGGLSRLVEELRPHPAFKALYEDVRLV